MPWLLIILLEIILIFNHLLIVLQKEWLCLNCQTQRALSGQLGDLPPPHSPSNMPAKSQPTPPSSPAIAVPTTPSPSVPTVTASPTKALIRTPSETLAPADKSEHDSVSADKCVVETAAVKQDEELAEAEHTQVVPEPNKEQTLDTTYENTTVKSAPPEQTIRAAVPPADISLWDIENAKDTDAKRQTEPKAQSKKGGENEPEQHEPVANDSPSNPVHIAEKHESTDKYPSEATVLDNKPEIRLDRLHVSKGKLKYFYEAKNGITSTVNSQKAHKAFDYSTEVVSQSENPTKECSHGLASLTKMQASAETIPDNNNGSNEDLVPSPIMMTETVNIDYVSTNTLESYFTPEKLIHSVQVISGKDEIKNEIRPNNGSDEKRPFAHTSKHANSTKGECGENEYEVEIKTGNMSPEKPYVYSVEEKQSGGKFKVEQESIAQGKAHKSTKDSQAPPAETPECANPAFPTPNELIKSELKTKHDILDKISYSTCLKTVDITSCTFFVLTSTDKNTHKRTEGVNLGATKSEAKGAEALRNSGS